MLTQAFKHQQVIADTVCKKPSVLGTSVALLCECGTGKTRIILDIIERRGFTTTLILCPAYVVDTWINEILKHTTFAFHLFRGTVVQKMERFVNFCMDTGPRILICSYESYVRWAEILEPKKFEMVVADEASIFSGYGKTVRLALRKFRNIKNKAIMTGTIIAEKYQDVFTPFYFLDGGRTFGDSYFYFLKNYFTEDFKGGWEVTDWGRKTIQQKLKYNPYIFTLSKKECLDLPPKIYQAYYYRMSKDQTKLDREIVKNWEAKIFNEDGELVTFEEFSYSIQILQKRMQICSNFMYIENGDNKKTIYRIPGKNQKLAVVQDFIKENRDEGIIIVYQYKAEEEILKEAGFKIFESHKDIKSFPGILACQIDKIKMGVDGFQDVANIAIFFSNKLSLKDRIQCEDRLHRSGQKKSVVIVDFICNGAYDAQIYYILKEKKKPLLELYNAYTESNRFDRLRIS